MAHAVPTSLAIHGGTPVRTRPFPSWPMFAEEERANLLRALDDGVWSDPSGGTFVQQFERGMAALQRTTHGIAVMNGTLSLVATMRAMEIGAGDEVIVPAYTFIATASAVLEANALPIFVDIDPETYCIAPDAVAAAITPRTKAIVAVHLGGHPADLDRLCTIARQHGLRLIEDSAHAHGAIWHERPVGSWGDAGSFSMQASKNLTGGEGGIVVTNDDDLAAGIVSQRNCGRGSAGATFEHVVLGSNFRMTEFQAAILVAQLTRFPEQRARRDANGQFLNAGLAEINGILPQKRDPRTSMHGYHLYSFRYQAAAFGGMTRDEFAAALRAEGIPCGAGYSLPLNQQPVFRNRAFDTAASGYDPANPATQFEHLDLPNTQVVCDEGIFIPQQVLLGDEADMQDIVTAIQKVRSEK